MSVKKTIKPVGGDPSDVPQNAAGADALPDPPPAAPPKKPGRTPARVSDRKPGVKDSNPSAIPNSSLLIPNSQKRILMVGSEAAPFNGTGGLGEVLGSLPQSLNALSDCGFEVSVIVPLYEGMSEHFRDKLEFLFKFNVPLSWRNQYCGLYRLVHGNTTYYFADNEYYFKRPNLYGYYDDGERFAFFCRAVVESLPKLPEKFDILHCHDWQTALVPIYYKLFYMYRQNYGGIKTVFTVHNIEYQGKFSKNILEDVFGIPNSEYFSLEHGGCINLLKGAFDYADACSTVSPSYAKELEDAFYAHGLEDIARKNRGKMRGILNGVDTETYNPEVNPALFKNFGVKNAGDKVKNKTELQKMLSLPENPDIPLIAMITRLVSHKGLDLVRFAMNEILKMNVQFVMLGKGDAEFESYFSHLQHMYDHKVASLITFNRDLSHKVYAAADIFLMPSKSEPCGLSQMMACRYGAVPVVRATGGLKDSITDCGAGDTGNGFVFPNYDAADMLH
ncbi:MAG: glycogen synthase, partial [Firmicutes bacterium]|nr:glycogen synthase [Bacillota bacterium]